MPSPRAFASRFTTLSLLLLWAGAQTAACSGNALTGKAGTNGSGTESGSTGSQADGAGGGIILSGGTGGGASGSGGFDACAATPYSADLLPLDMYVMLDQSGSMKDKTALGPTKWEAVTKALNSFVVQPKLDGIAIGIQYFGLPAASGQCPPFCTKDADCGNNGPCQLFQCAKCGFGGNDSCQPADYAKPEVEIAALPGIAGAIQASLAKHMPGPGTPTIAALGGAVQHAEEWAVKNPNHVTVAVLATDGKPAECDTNTDNVAAVAAAGLKANPPVKTFAIGVFAPGDIPAGPDMLAKVATAGGTGKPFVIDTNNPNVDVEKEFLAALNAIRGSALGCQYKIPVPKMGTPDFDQVNVQYTPGGGMAQTIPAYPDKAHCPAKGDGWYYDNPAAPKLIILCGSTCDKVSADAKGKMNILLGCKTVGGPL